MQHLVREHRCDGRGLAVDKHAVAHQSDAVAVVGIEVDVPGVERLDRRAVLVVPSVNHDVVLNGSEQTGYHYVLLDAGNDLTERGSRALLFDLQVVGMEQRGRQDVVGLRAERKGC